MASNGAERVRAETLEAFAGRFSSCGFGAHALYPVYGLAEATLAVTAPEVGTGYRVDPAPPTANGNGAGAGCVSVGHPFADHELRVVDGEGRSLPERCVGEIWVRGPSVCCGYVNDPEASARLLARGWLHTGDLGYLAQGDLHVVGRLGGKIVVRGKNYHAEEIEEVVERLPGVRPNGVLAFGVESDATESVVVAAEVRHAGVLHDAERLRRQMRELVARYCGLVPADVLVLGPNSIRRTSSGKKRRDDFREQYLAYRSLGGQIPRSPH